MTEPAPAEITAYLDVTTGTPEGVDVIFIPGTRIAEPAQIAATMLDHDVASVAVLTGGINPRTGRREARDHYHLLVEHGISPDRLVVEDESTNTLENVTMSLPLLQSHIGQFSTVLAITKWMHSRRVLMTLKANRPSGIRYYANTYAPQGVTRTNWADGPAAETVTHNWECIPRYLETGHLAEIALDEHGAYI
jgi:hypothetical protein